MKCAFIIPTYNRADLVGQAVESALGQTIPGEVVVVDDGSTDGTAERLSAFGKRIRVLTQDNAERGAARNRGAREVPEAELLFFLDADDVAEPNHATTLVALFRENPKASLLVGRAWVTDENLEPLAMLPGKPGREVTLASFLKGKDPLAPSFLAVPRRTFDAVGGFPEDRALAGSEDWVFAGRALACAPALRGTEVTLRMRKHSGNSMANASAMHRSMLQAHALLFGEETPPAQRPPRDLKARSMGDLLVRSAIGYYAAGKMAMARRILLDAVRLDPRLVLDPRISWTFLRSLLGSRISSALRHRKQEAIRASRRPGASP